MVTLKDVRVGDCFRFIGEDAPTDQPMYCDTKANSRAPWDMPSHWDALDADTPTKSYGTKYEKYQHEPIEFIEHYQVSKIAIPLTRGCIQVGECFEYLSGGKVLMVADARDWFDVEIPPGWKIGERKPEFVELALHPVRRIPRWDFTGKWKGIPGSTAHSPPPSVLHQALTRVTEGLTGAECLERFERSMQMESICRVPGSDSNYVSTHGDVGLTQDQVVAARTVWSLKLAAKQKEARRRDQAKSVSIVTDHGDD